MELTIIVRDGPEGKFWFRGDQLALTVTYDRQGVTNTSLKGADGTLFGSAEQSMDQSMASELDLKPFASAMQVLTSSMYVGPFRNVINIGGQGSYYDIQIGEEFIRAFAGYKSGSLPDWNEAVYELTREIKRIFGFEILEINAASDYQ